MREGWETGRRSRPERWSAAPTKPLPLSAKKWKKLIFFTTKTSLCIVVGRSLLEYFEKRFFFGPEAKQAGTDRGRSCEREGLWAFTLGH